MKKQVLNRCNVVLLVSLLSLLCVVPVVQAAPVWIIETAYSASHVLSSATSLALDNGDNPHISYTVIGVVGHDSQYSTKSGGTWASEIVESENVAGKDSSLALDSSGKPHISFIETSPSTKLYYASKSGSTWTIETVAKGGSLFYTSLEFDSSGNPHISYLNNSEPQTLMYASKSGAGWTNEPVATDVGSTNSLAFDLDGNPHISYYDLTNSALMYASKSGAGWTSELVDNDVTHTGQYSSLAFDSYGNPHISYFAGGANGCLRYASKSGGTWTTEIADNPGTGKYVGYYTSLALDGDDNPHISYYAGGNVHDLKYATKSGGTWTKTTVDSTGDVGQYTSIALDSHDRPHISYFSTSGRSLKYASLVSNSQSVPTATGTGNAVFTTSAGVITNLNAVSEGTLATAGKPANVVFPHGLFSFTITGLSSGQTVTVDIVLPSNVPVGSQYWKYQNDIWSSTPIPIGSDNGDNVISITLTDGGIGDSDGVANGVIVDPGGIGVVPEIESCLANGVREDTFIVGDTVYAKGSDFATSTTYPIYVVVDVASWANGQDIPARVAGSATSVSTDNSGSIATTAIWLNAQPGKYDIVVDVNSNGKYDAHIDALDNNDIAVTAGFFVVPETPFGTTLVCMIAALVVFTTFKRSRTKPKPT
jgi:hypothetical protein